MTKPEAVEAFHTYLVNKQHDITKKDTKLFLDEVFNFLKDEVLAKGETLSIQGFGTFQTKQNAATVRRNPKTGQSVSVPAKKVPKIKFSSTLKKDIA